MLKACKEFTSDRITPPPDRSPQYLDNMKIRPEDPQKLTDFKLLSFDCFGTLVDWESGIYDELKPLLDRLPSSNAMKHDRALAIKRFDEFETSLCASKPALKYSTLLEESYLLLAESLSLPTPPKPEVETVGASICKWPAFPDTVEALHRLQKHYKLVILSNVDRKSFDQVLAGPFADVKFDAVYVAEEIGSYKPDLKNFHYLLEHVKSDLGVEKEQILHTAHGLKADHVPSKQIGLSSAWIARGELGGLGSTLEVVEGKTAYTWQFDTMGDMADDADKIFTEAHK